MYRDKLKMQFATLLNIFMKVIKNYNKDKETE
jgi:hypothetical protein